MKLEIDPDRMQSIYHVLTEIAYGNYAYKLKRTGTNDEFDALIEIINMTIENIKASFRHHSFIDPHRAYTYLSNMGFMLNEKFRIEDMNAVALKILERDLKDLRGKPFADILTRPSQKKWKALQRSLSQDMLSHFSGELTFNVQEGYETPAFCNFSRFPNSKSIHISSVQIVQQDTIIEELVQKGPPPKAENNKGNKNEHPDFSFNEPDVRLIQDVYNYISGLLEEPLPPLKDLARSFGTNQKKLKYGFKHLFKTSVYQYYNEKRLARAVLLIRNSRISLKTIAVMTGFKTYSSFYRAFKLKYGCAPGKIKRGDKLPDDPDLLE